MLCQGNIGSGFFFFKQKNLYYWMFCICGKVGYLGIIIKPLMKIKLLQTNPIFKRFVYLTTTLDTTLLIDTQAHNDPSMLKVQKCLMYLQNVPTTGTLTQVQADPSRDVISDYRFHSWNQTDELFSQVISNFCFLAFLSVRTF